MFNPLSFLARPYRRRLLYPFVSVALALSLIVGTPQVSQAISWFDLIFQGVQIIQLSNISDRQEVEIGGQINKQLVGNQFQLYRNSDINRYVDQIGQRLAQESPRPNIPYTFQIVRDDSINAFATMGGYVYVTTGLLAAADNEAEVASVLAHETGHITERHSIKQMRQTAIARGVAVAAGLDRSTLVNLGVELALRLPNSREDEFEADQVGLNILRQAGYAPSAMVKFMEKLNSRRSVPSFLSTHPATQDRINALKQAIEPTEANTGMGLNESAYKAKIRPLL
ncbi:MULTISPECIES: M48 family metallopeptidase [unclassified Coleofasciculus]|uniref:M48 family metallopeptidase n=1 Tax=unclassified Coleofasciculus TaxID=2692782 RepID=UPI0018824A3B|nr:MULTISPECIES: M48 family metallopeptidase [unclassified Coleofasciculus]MBE9127536.1 M48 family metalloprotease [Coleofasciculus sp. LEGE 07081]MBE9150879.1 M48 family metalloprotease [Coleofasciculus sp. LEGE 07092]